MNVSSAIITINIFFILHIFLFVCYLLVTCKLPLNFNTIFKYSILFQQVKTPEKTSFSGVLL